MKIILIAPPIFDFYSTPHRMEPLGLLYIKEALEMAGHSVFLYDSTLSGKVKKQKTPNEFKYLDNYYQEDSSPFSLHFGFKRFGDSFQKIISHIENNRYDLIALSSLFSAYRPDVEILAAEIKKRQSAPIVIGGTAINAEARNAAETTNADYLIRGNGAISLTKFADALSNGLNFDDVPGLIYKKNGTIVFNEPSFEPAWSGGLIPKRENLRSYRGKKIAATIFSSGCKNRCAFCSIHRENRLAYREISRIKQELDYLLNIGAQIVDIEDDDIFSNSESRLQLIDLLTETHKKGAEFTAMNGLTAKNILPIADRLADAGFIKLDLSLVSTSKVVGANLKRPHGVDVIEKIAEIVSGKIEIETFLIPGLPGSTLAETFDALIYLHKLGIKCALSPLYIVPSVPMFEKMGIPENKRFCRGSAIYPFNEETRANIASLLKISRFLNYSLAKSKSAEYDEFRFYFKESLKRKQWFKRDKTGNWSDSFKFSEGFDFNVF